VFRDRQARSLDRIRPRFECSSAVGYCSSSLRSFDTTLKKRLKGVGPAGSGGSVAYRRMVNATITKAGLETVLLRQPVHLSTSPFLLPDHCFDLVLEALLTPEPEPLDPWPRAPSSAQIAHRSRGAACFDCCLPTCYTWQQLDDI
jgi:hypothetical protein